jgi:hypothetical protein
MSMPESTLLSQPDVTGATPCHHTTDTLKTLLYSTPLLLLLHQLLLQLLYLLRRHLRWQRGWQLHMWRLLLLLLLWLLHLRQLLQHLWLWLLLLLLLCWLLHVSDPLLCLQQLVLLLVLLTLLLHCGMGQCW